MKVTLRINNKRRYVDLNETEKLAVYRRYKDLEFRSINGYVTWLTEYKYAKEREFFTNYAEFARWCVKKDLRGVK